MASPIVASSKDAETETEKLETVSYQLSKQHRCIRLEGYSLAGRSDLTHLGKATGEALWPCATLMADYMVEHPSEWKSETAMSVLELGCGLGLVGTVASILLASPNSSVVLTDGDHAVLQRAKQLSAQNSKPGDASVRHYVLQWGRVESETFRTECLEKEVFSGFDLILGSDILYDDTDAEQRASAFAATVDTLLAPLHASTTSATPQCLVCFQRRGLAVEVLIEAFDKVGFCHRTPVGDDVFEDLFLERHDEETMCTVRFLLLFERRSETSNGDLSRETDAGQ